MNVRVHLMYRDALNYKTGLDVVFAGPFQPELVDRLTRALDDGEWIVCEQVGLRFQHPVRANPLFMNRFPDAEDDHGYVEVCTELTEPTDAPVTDERSFAQFVTACEAAKESGWDPDICIAAWGGWRRSTTEV